MSGPVRGGLFAAIAFLRSVNFIQIPARFGRRMAGGERLVDVAWRHAVNDVRRLDFIAGETRAVRCRRRRYRR